MYLVLCFLYKTTWCVHVHCYIRNKHSHAGGKATFIMSGFVDLIVMKDGGETL